MSLSLSFFVRVVPESIRWHVAHNNHKEALEIAAKIAKYNKRSLPDDLEIQVITNFCGKKPTDYTIIDLFKTAKTRKRSIIMFYIW